MQARSGMGVRIASPRAPVQARCQPKPLLLGAGRPAGCLEKRHPGIQLNAIIAYEGLA